MNIHNQEKRALPENRFLRFSKVRLFDFFLELYGSTSIMDGMNGNAFQ
jgi:hypothetical protein